VLDDRCHRPPQWSLTSSQYRYCCSARHWKLCYLQPRRQRSACVGECAVDLSGHCMLRILTCHRVLLVSAHLGGSSFMIRMFLLTYAGSSPIPEITDADMEFQASQATDADVKPFRQQYRLFHAAFAQFCYTGAQVGIAGFVSTRSQHLTLHLRILTHSLPSSSTT
jgi:hypothetical protein